VETDPAEFKHPEWVKPGWIAFKLDDENARDLLWFYARRIRKQHPRLADEIHEALRAHGYDPINQLPRRS
jgi:hypothetical protein